MRHLTLIAVALLTMAAAPIGDPSLPQFTPAEKVTIQAALQKLLKDNPDGDEKRVQGALNAISSVTPFGPRDIPLIGLALSRASKDPEACALLKRIEPTAVCMK